MTAPSWYLRARGCPGTGTGNDGHGSMVPSCCTVRAAARSVAGDGRLLVRYLERGQAVGPLRLAERADGRGVDVHPSVVPLRRTARDEAIEHERDRLARRADQLAQHPVVRGVEDEPSIAVHEGALARHPRERCHE